MIREIGPDDWRDWRNMRQRSLAEDPAAFSSSTAMWTGDNDTELRWRARIAGGPCFIAYEDSTPVGMVGAGIVDENVELISMWVAPEARRRGFGARLIAEILRWADDRPLRLRVMDGNGSAVAAYEASGFVLDAGCADAEGCRIMVLKP